MAIRAKKHMPQRLFNFGASSIARMHLISGAPLPQLVALVSSRSSYRDAHVQRDWLEAAEQALKLLRERDVSSPEAVLHHFQYFVDEYEPDGRPRRRRPWGSLFSRAKLNPRRKQEFLDLFETFCVRARAGLVPLAPPGWPGDRSAFREFFTPRARRAT
jgi:hypothetical protein